MSNAAFDAEKARDFYKRYVDTMIYADSCGFDWIGCNEHHFSPYGLMANCDVIGHSFGGWVAMWLAVDFPEVVDQLVLEAPAGFRIGGAGGLGGSPAELQKRMFAHPEKIPPETRSPDVLAANRAAAGSYAPNDAVDPELSKRLGDVAALTLVLHGTADGVIPVESPRFLKANLPHAHVIYIYDAAHNIEIDQPERFVELVGDFLRRGETFLVNAGSVAQA